MLSTSYPYINIPPVPCDNPDDGVPSDHWVPVCYPHTDRYNPPLRSFRTVTYRPLPEENVCKFGQWITAETFKCIDDKLSPSEHAEQLQQLLLIKLDELCPVQTMKISAQDKPFINKELKVLNRQKQREWIKKGKSAKYNKLAAEYTRISAHADGGPRSRVCARETLRSAPQRHERKFSGTRFCRVTFKIFEKNLKKPKNRPQGARGWGFEFYFFPIIFIIFF